MAKSDKKRKVARRENPVNEFLNTIMFTVREMYDHGKEYPEDKELTSNMAQGVLTFLGVAYLIDHGSPPFSLSQANEVGNQILRHRIKSAVDSELMSMEEQFDG